MLSQQLLRLWPFLFQHDNSGLPLWSSAATPLTSIIPTMYINLLHDCLTSSLLSPWLNSTWNHSVHMLLSQKYVSFDIFGIFSSATGKQISHNKALPSTRQEETGSRYLIFVHNCSIKCAIWPIRARTITAQPLSDLHIWVRKFNIIIHISTSDTVPDPFHQPLMSLVTPHHCANVAAYVQLWWLPSIDISTPPKSLQLPFNSSCLKITANAAWIMSLLDLSQPSSTRPSSLIPQNIQQIHCCQIQFQTQLIL